jgi:tRNA threonylcarbamoyladenosine biosynthesis protein TsaE
MNLTTSSSAETKNIGAEFAERILGAGKSSRATVVALNGELGAGKTTFIQGFFKGLGLRRVPASPTFIIMRRAELKKGPFRNVYHLDAYRLESGQELQALQFQETLANPENLILIEWADKVKDILPRAVIKIRFAHGREENSRRITLP